jgi:GDPmannose 4,6-dehydratase
MINNRILVFGVTGQDGSYLIENLITKGWEVHGVVRKSATSNTRNIDHLIENQDIINKKLFIHHGDLLDSTSIYRLIMQIKPCQIYNEADQDHVTWSKEIPDYSIQTTISGPLHIFEAVRIINPEIKVFQPVSSNIFGKSENILQSEETALNPVSPYGIAKASVYQLVKYYRNELKLKLYTSIFYNHESPRRSPEYVTRKITSGAARIKKGLQKELFLGDLDAQIDWGYAPEYMEIATKIMETDNPDDFIVSTGKLHSVREFAKKTFEILDLNYLDFIKTSESLIRKTSTSALMGDNSKLIEKVGIKPNIHAMQIAEIMVDNDLRLNGGK